MIISAFAGNRPHPENDDFIIGEAEDVPGFFNCPLGCHMTAVFQNHMVTNVTGNTCKRGKAYAMQEAILPMRILTGNMRAKGCIKPFSVKTDGLIPKSLLMDCAAELKKYHPELPIKRGDVIIENVLNTGVNIIATQDCELSVSSRLEHEPPFLARLNMHYPEKQRIALAAHRLVQPNDILFLGAGTSVYEFAKTLSDISPLYVTTNDLKNAIELAEYENVDLTVLGGTLRQPHYSLNGCAMRPR